jgi:hypothetical protein
MSQTIARPIDEVLATAGRLDEYRPYQRWPRTTLENLSRSRSTDQRISSGPELEIASSELTNRQAAQVHAPVLGRPVKFRRLPIPIVKVALRKEFFQMFDWCNDSGYQADVTGLGARYPERQPRTPEDRREEGWEEKRDITVRRDKLGRPLTQT